MALTYQLTAEISGSEHLKKVPEKKMTITCSKKPLQKATDIAGFYFPEKNTENEVKNSGDSTDSNSHVGDSSLDVKDSSSDVNDISIKDQVNERVQEVDNEKQLNENSDSNMEESDDQKTAELVDSENAETIHDEEDNLNDDAEEDDDDVGWITPSNINQVKNHIDSDLTEANTVKVGCLTTDFAMQNVLIQIGLSVVSVDGMLIKKAKSYALRCYSCFKITSNNSKVFCPKCGNKTLTKVTVTVDEDGTQRYHLSSRRAINKRGLKYPLPLPKGGKHAVNPVLVEDQPIPQNRPAKKTLAKINAFDPDYVARGSPFAINDVTSRAAQLGVHSSRGSSSRRRNPNESGHRKGRKK
ncbi:RNA-binding protein NOB1-like isoform X3 [Anneissia japonica]|nr:RNA-binding protein NOB1-like isoform X3 [Anneissia japonica]